MDDRINLVSVVVLGCVSGLAVIGGVVADTLGHSSTACFAIAAGGAGAIAGFLQHRPLSTKELRS
jgi:outer membrane lipoprotein SlyB